MRLILPVLSGLSLWAQNSVVQGTVVNGIDGSALNGVHIRLYKQSALGEAPYGAISEKTGHFSMNSVAANTYELTTELTGYVQAPEYDIHGQLAKPILELAAGTPQELRIEMVPRAVIRGRVTDEAGNPVAYPKLDLRDEAGEMTLGAASKSANALGEYRLVVAPGKYLVRANQDGMAAWLSGRTATPPLAYSDTFFPNALLPERGTVVEVGAGQTKTDINISLLRRRKLTVSGKLDAMPAEGCQASVLLEQKVGRLFLNPRDSKPGPDQQFSFSDLESGRYRLSASGDPKYSTVYRQFDLADADMTGIDLELTTGVEWVGTVDVPESQQLSRYVLRFKSPGGEYQAQSYNFPTDERGRFSVTGLPRRTQTNLSRRNDEWH